PIGTAAAIITRFAAQYHRTTEVAIGASQSTIRWTVIQMYGHLDGQSFRWTVI
ncbi:MAG: hypothetical protein ACI9G1_005594, partial [Pirellulaceae bacterium]